MTWDRPHIVLLQRSKKVLQVYFCQDLYTVFQVSRISHKMVVVDCMIFQTHVCVCACTCVCTCVWCMFFIFYIPLGNGPNCCTPSQVSSLLQVTAKGMLHNSLVLQWCQYPCGCLWYDHRAWKCAFSVLKLSGSLSICCFFAQPLCTQFKHMCWFRLAVQWSRLHSRFVTFFILPEITNGHTAKQVCMMLYSRLPSWLCFPLVCSMLKHGLNVLLSWFCDSEQLRQTPCFVIY